MKSKTPGIEAHDETVDCVLINATRCCIDDLPPHVLLQSVLAKLPTADLLVRAQAAD